MRAHVLLDQRAIPMVSVPNTVAVIPFVDMGNHDLRHANAQWTGFTTHPGPKKLPEENESSNGNRAGRSWKHDRERPAAVESVTALKKIRKGDEIKFNYFANHLGRQDNTKKVNPNSFHTTSENELLVTIRNARMRRRINQLRNNDCANYHCSCVKVLAFFPKVSRSTIRAGRSISCFSRK